MEFSQLEDALHAVDPAVVLAPSWLLRQVIAFDRGLTGPGVSVPHRQCYVISRQRLIDITHSEELPFAFAGTLAPTVILLTQPDAEWLAATEPRQILLTYWRMLFHARVDAAISHKLAELSPASAEVQQRIDRLGRPLLGEARAVLHKERFITAQADDRQVYTELAAVFLELLFFDPVALSHFFPAAEPQAVLDVLAEDVDAAALWRRIRPRGASLEGAISIDEGEAAHDGAGAGSPAVSATSPVRAGGAAALSARQRSKMLARAHRLAQRGNTVKAAILAIRLAGSGGGNVEEAESLAQANLQALVTRLSAAMEFDADQVPRWRAALRPLLASAADGWWNPERRLLYDLQKVCIDHELGVYSVGVVEWVLALGRQPLRRPLPAQEVVLIFKHLRLAVHHLSRVRLPEADRNALEQLLTSAVEQAQRRLRQRLRPVVGDAVAANLHPRLAVEEIAQNKLVDELMDGVVQRGYCTMGDLRDMISRNQLKCDDLGSAREFFQGDQLLRIDRTLKQSLDGVYRGGEIYRRGFQRLSSLMFATPAGRFLTRYLVMPFGGAYILLAGLDHTVGVLVHKLSGHALHLAHPAMLGSLGFFLLGLVNWPAMRRWVGWLLGQFFHWLGMGLIDVPLWLANRPLVHKLINGRPMRLLARYMLKPLLVMLVVQWLLPAHIAPSMRVVILSTVFLLANMTMNSWAGRLLEQTLLHSLAVLWTRFAGDILAGAFRLITAIFQGLLENLDRMLYAVDEWLRFRTGQRRLALVSKAILGVAWFFVTYVTRFVINLLVEPQINPIKHFPVVTVSHKIILPTVKLIASGFERLGFKAVQAKTAAGIVVFSIPGIFGFLAWELKNNWGLYKANRPRTLRAAVVGSHGESMARLLRPGLHSGTIPKLFARLRRADRRTGFRRWASARKHSRALDHVRHEVGHFLQRQFVAMLNQHRLWRQSPVQLGQVDLSTNRISITLHCPMAGGEQEQPARIYFEQRGGWIMAGIDQAGWMAQLDRPRADLLSVALLGLYKMSAVDIVVEQLQQLFAPMAIRFDLQHDQLLVWPAGRYDRRVRYNLRQLSMVPTVVDKAAGEMTDLPVIDAQRLLLGYTSVEWEQWVRCWQEDAAMPGQMLRTVAVMPVTGFSVAV